MNILTKVIFLSLPTVSLVATAQPIDLADTPIFVNNAAPPLNLLVMGKDHKLYYEAYNDASDLNGDGVLDVGYKPDKIDYYGYFTSNLCYTHNGKEFIPVSKAKEHKTCNGQWSGDFLNYLGTSRIDALRKVLYGGKRTEDTASRTVITGAYIPQDAHSWGKEYTSPAVDGYDITKYTPLSQPAHNRRHLFATVTLENTNPVPTIGVAQNSEFRIWDWVSKEAPVAGDKCWGNRPCASKIDRYRLNVEVCPPGKPELHDDNCTTYGMGAKPTGILHDFGNNNQMYFGLLTGSYDNNLSGGALRSNIDSFSKEYDASTGIFKKNYNGIVKNIDALSIYGFNVKSPGKAYQEYCGLLSKPLDEEKNQKCYNWGNPIAEMMYEGLRYFSNKTTPTGLYNARGSVVDQKVGLSAPTWLPPYTRAKDPYPVCAKPVMTVISDINPSYDYKVPGSRWYAMSGDISFDAKDQADAIGRSERLKGKKVFIGESDGTADYAPSPKTIENLSTVRGLAPEEPSKVGTYYSAAVARHGAIEGINSDAKTKNKMMTYAVALASPLPKINFPTPKGNVTIVPFGKSVGGGYGMDAEAAFQPTLSIVDFYVQKIVNVDKVNEDPNTNGGRAYAEFRINYEDVEQGNDHDMDAIVLYKISLNEQGEVVVELDKEYEAAGIIMHMGYVISGTTHDGVYLDVKSKGAVNYRLNTPPGKLPGYCTPTRGNYASGCNQLPLKSKRLFIPDNTEAAEVLPSPLWYAAKYGMPGRDPAQVHGDPDNYFLVTNALTLKEQLTKAFADIVQRNSATTKPAVSKMPSAGAVESGMSVYRTGFDIEDWSGSLIKETIDPLTNKLTPSWQASIDERSRKVQFYNPKNAGLAEFTWANLDGLTFSGKSLRSLLNSSIDGADNKGAERVKYIRGEGVPGFRPRSSLLGDIVNSNPIVVEGAQYLAHSANKLEPNKNYEAFIAKQNKKEGIVYVGANDGMLHGFSAKDGKEKFAFIPTPVIENLHRLTHLDYGKTERGTHNYYVDGALVVSDVVIKGEWRSVLVGTLGAGGRGVFAFDITDPDEIKILWELTSDTPSTFMEPNRPASSELGYTFGEPVIVKLNNGKWAALVNNGYNSPNAGAGTATLFVIDIANGDILAKLTAQGVGKNNGLSSIKVADFDGDGVADFAYAGDMQGNLWRFDLNFSAGKKGGVSFTGKPMFTAKDSNGLAQPITTPPNIVRHPTSKGYLILFGTGRYLATSDKLPPFNVQSVYGIWDAHTRKGDAGANKELKITRGNLLAQKFMRQEVTDIGDDFRKETHEIRTITTNTPDWNKHQGWYIDLISPNTDLLDGERMVDDMIVRGQVLFFSTRTPSTDVCSAGVDGWNYTVNPYTGGRTHFNVLDLNKNMSIGAEDSFFDGSASYPVTGYKAPPGGIVLRNDKLFNSDGVAIDVNLGSGANGRQSWYVVPAEIARPSN